MPKKKIDVHNTPGLNWGNPDNQVDYITRLHLLLREHPAFFSEARLKLVHDTESRALVLLRVNPGHNALVVVLVNPDCDSQAMAVWPAGLEGDTASGWTDLISANSVQAETRKGKYRILLEPGAVLALSPDKEDLGRLESQASGNLCMPDRVLMQKRRSLALEIITAVNGHYDLGDLDVDQAAMDLARTPETFIRELYTDKQPCRTIVFDAHKDVTRRVMVPPGFFLLVRCNQHFRVQLEEAGSDNQCLGFRESLPIEANSGFQAIFMPQEIKENHRDCLLKLRISGPEGTKKITGTIRYLAPFASLILRRSFTRREIAQDLSIKQLSTTCLGGMMRAAGSFSHLESRYDALMGANLKPCPAREPVDAVVTVQDMGRIPGLFQGTGSGLPGCLLGLPCPGGHPSLYFSLSWPPIFEESI